MPIKALIDFCYLNDEKMEIERLQGWAMACFHCLRAIKYPKTENIDIDIAIPCVLQFADSGTYKIFFVQEMKDRFVMTTMHEGMMIGGVKTRFEECQRLSVLTALADWVENVYKPWFLNWVGIQEPSASSVSEDEV